MGDGASGARVIPLPVEERVKSCWVCKHAQFGGPLTVCRLVGEQIIDERGVAAECEDYEEREQK